MKGVGKKRLGREGFKDGRSRRNCLDIGHLQRGRLQGR